MSSGAQKRDKHSEEVEQDEHNVQSPAKLRRSVRERRPNTDGTASSAFVSSEILFSEDDDDDEDYDEVTISMPNLKKGFQQPTKKASEVNARVQELQNSNEALEKERDACKLKSDILFKLAVHFMGIGKFAMDKLEEGDSKDNTSSSYWVAAHMAKKVVAGFEEETQLLREVGTISKDPVAHLAGLDLEKAVNEFREQIQKNQS
ncbi:uncharacterized protein PAC_18725 [Phialocephala subalpina]|uniref:Uncharacterized protein n=1 Tax=Phialocephala subalpina TaxID=576137 RepID=A0A1L7XV23_9HELO|nr:uncharacterized protein PAC_18725 [Phialocephala subalpina]